MSETKKRFGRNVTRYMLKRGKTSAMLAAEIRVPQRTIQHWMHGDHLPIKHGYHLLAKSLRAIPTRLLTEGE
jgi:ribosome-binding protein aMBF1 (putative translation factor)